MIFHNVSICGIINFSIRVLPHVEKDSRIENADQKAGEKE
jgi:hypothetical protein